MIKSYPIIDLHVHLRNDIPKHTRIARESGIDVVVYMANCNPPLDNLERIKKSLKEKLFLNPKKIIESNGYKLKI